MVNCRAGARPDIVDSTVPESIQYWHDIPTVILNLRSILAAYSGISEPFTRPQLPPLSLDTAALQRRHDECDAAAVDAGNLRHTRRRDMQQPCIPAQLWSRPNIFCPRRCVYLYPIGCVVCSPYVRTYRLPVVLPDTVGKHPQHVVRHDHHPRPKVPGSRSGRSGRGASQVKSPTACGTKMSTFNCKEAADTEYVFYYSTQHTTIPC